MQSRSRTLRRTTVSLVIATLLSACQGGGGTAAPPAASQPASSPDAGRSAPPPGPSNNPPPNPPAVDPTSCFTGSYAVASITGKQGVTTPVGAARPAGAGGSMLFDLRADNTWKLSSDGSRPVAFEVGPYQVDAVINGTLEGSYRRTGSTFVFKQEDATGTVTLSTPQLGSREYDMDVVGPALAPSGAATLTCQTDGADFVSESVTMMLKRR